LKKYFKQGELIHYREMDGKGVIIDVKPVTVVEDNNSQTLLWLPLGVRTKKPVLAKPRHAGEAREWVEGQLADGIWKYAELLIIIKPNQPWATWVKWSSDRVFKGWYINFQRLLSRTEHGFDIRDHQLDLEISPSKECKVKDMVELENDVKKGKLTVDQSDEIKKDCELALDEIKNKKGVLFEGWEDWTPKINFPRPVIKSNWSILSKS
jgi:hypothetical protein